MEAKQLDDITAKFTREYYQGRVGWVDGVDHSVEVAAFANSNQVKPEEYGSAHPSILVKYVKYMASNPLHALPRGSPSAVTFPKSYEKVPIVYRPA